MSRRSSIDSYVVLYRDFGLKRCDFGKLRCESPRGSDAIGEEEEHPLGEGWRRVTELQYFGATDKVAHDQEGHETQCQDGD